MVCWGTSPGYDLGGTIRKSSVGSCKDTTNSMNKRKMNKLWKTRLSDKSRKGVKGVTIFGAQSKKRLRVKRDQEMKGALRRNVSKKVKG